MLSIMTGLRLNEGQAIEPWIYRDLLETMVEDEARLLDMSVSRFVIRQYSFTQASLHGSVGNPKSYI
jgi:hypothetical protein